MIDLDISLVVQLINFLITLVVLNYLIISPIRQIIKKREDTVAGMVSEAERFAGDAEAKLNNYEKALIEARRSASEERDKTREAGAEQEKELVSAANKDAQETLTAARAEIGKQASAALESLKAQVPGMADKVVAKVLN